MKTTKTKQRRNGISLASFLRRTSFVCLLLGVICPPCAALGQQSASQVSRTIEGNVLDHAGHPVSGAVVLIKDLKSLQIRSYIAQADGKYHFHGLSSDANYQLWAQLNGVAGGSKTVSIFDSKPTVVVNLKIAANQKRRAVANPPSGKSL
jgi:hypothetical protein